MENSSQLKQIVKDKYTEVITQKSSCCGDNFGCSPEDVQPFLIEEYSKIDGYVAEADYNLGCGVPTQFAEIKKGNTVLDLGAGAGNDVFIVRRIVGEEGKVIGLDMTPEMIAKANQNKDKLGYKNVEFHLGDIEEMPFENNRMDVVISNCVLNLVPDKEKAFREIYRVLKPGGHFCISDIVSSGEMPEALKKSAEAYAGCVSGAIPKENYLQTIKESGFINVEIKRSHTVGLPDSLLKTYMTEQQIADYRKNETGIFSITVVGYKS